MMPSSSPSMISTSSAGISSRDSRHARWTSRTAAWRSATRDDDGLEAAAEFLKGNVASYLYAAAELDAQPPDQLDLGVDEIARQAVRGYACIQHPGGPRFGFEDGGSHAHEGQVMRRSQSRRSGTDDGDAESVRP